MTPLLRISAARAEHQSSAGVWALVLRLKREHPNCVVVAQRVARFGAQMSPVVDGRMAVLWCCDGDRVIYSTVRQTA